jgi:alpha-amylase
VVDVCFYFQVHQPNRLKNYSIFEIGKSHSYFNDVKNEKILRKVAEKCYIPANNAVLDLIHRHEGRFKVSYGISGCILDQFERFMPELIESFRALLRTGCVEFLDETYYHSLASVFNKDEFIDQVKLHSKKMQDVFGYKPHVFRNTELIYSNDIAKTAEEMGYIGVLAEGFDKILQWRNPNFVYKPVNSNIKLLLRNYMLSDDIAFRFGNMEWNEYPLTADKFATWINNINGNGQIVNLFMDYETFGEHQWAEKGIFDFLKCLPEEILKNPDNAFVTPSEAFTKYEPSGELDVPDLTSWADTERDLTAWLGNKMQQEAVQKLYEMRDIILRSNVLPLIDDWRKLQTSDHFYYMCTKWFSDGDVHKYFNPFDTPYDALISFMNILNDLRIRLKEVNLMNGAEKKWLADVPQDRVFWLKDGDSIRNILEMSSALRTMDTDVFGYHVNAERNDFAKWVKLVVGDEVLARNLEKCTRSITAAKMVEERIKYLKK